MLGSFFIVKESFIYVWIGREHFSFAEWNWQENGQ